MTNQTPTKIDAHDLGAALGLCLMSVGLWWIWPPVALVVVGLILLLASVSGARRARKR